MFHTNNGMRCVRVCVLSSDAGRAVVMVTLRLGIRCMYACDSVRLAR